MTVTLHRIAAGFANSMFESSDSLLLGSGCSGHMEDFFFQNRAVQIVHPVAERHLCERQSEADPIGSQVIDVIQIHAAHREIAKLLKRRSTFDVRKDSEGLGRFECERNETGESARLIL